ncbi:MAG: DUF4332 domain-containing protein [Lachnospiraceae bacterium]|nr:DUF4332 domain-containing protein [Lachnospiraceae bacterium]
MELTEISGVSSDLASRLKKAGIHDAKELAEATDSVQKRGALSQKLGESPIVVSSLAKQTELLRCSKIKPADAEALVRAGVRCIEDLKKSDPDKLADFMFDRGINADIDEEVAFEWVAGAVDMKESMFEADPGDMYNSALAFVCTKNYGLSHSNMYGTDISDIITELGVGIARAQHALDKSSAEMQREILKSPELAAMGFNATWYTIPETSFTLKMEYTYSETGNSEKHFSVVPMNATYNNAFRTDRAEESTLSLRFVPIPPPAGMTERITVPDFVGMSVEEAEAAAADLGLKASFAYGTGVCTADQPSMITRQSIAAGTLVMGSELIRMTYVDSESRMAAQKLVGVLRARLKWVRNRIAELEAKYPEGIDLNATGEAAEELLELLRLKYGSEVSTGTSEVSAEPEASSRKKKSAKDEPSAEAPKASEEPEGSPPEEKPVTDEPAAEAPKASEDTSAKSARSPKTAESGKKIQKEAKGTLAAESLEGIKPAKSAKSGKTTKTVKNTGKTKSTGKAKKE